MFTSDADKRALDLGLSPVFLVCWAEALVASASPLLCEGECKGEAHFVFAWRGGGEADGTHRLSALRRITDNWRVMLSRSPADRCQSACSKSRGYALLFFPYTAINPVFSPVCEECSGIPMTRLRPTITPADKVLYVCMCVEWEGGGGFWWCVSGHLCFINGCSSGFLYPLRIFLVWLPISSVLKMHQLLYVFNSIELFGSTTV